MSDNEKPHPGVPPGSKPGAAAEAPEELQNKAREIVYQTPEVRPEKVAEIKEAIEAGTYEIDSEKLADKLIDELLPELAKPSK